MKKWIYLGFAVVLFLQCKTAGIPDYNGKELGFSANYISAKTLKTKLYTLASDEFEGRETGERGQKKAAKYLKEFYQKHKIKGFDGDTSYYQHISASYFNNRIKGTENIIAVIPGSEFPDEVVVLSAHYDHLGIRSDGEIYNGADDDGSGTVAVMEMALAFKKAADKGLPPRRTVVFAHFTAEEKGLLGSQYYTAHPIFPLKNTIANLNVDMLGRIDSKHQSDPNYVYVIGSGRLSSQLDSILNVQNQKFVNLELDFTYDDENDPKRLYYRSDHYNFAKHNTPVAFFFSGLHADYHKVTDTAEKIDYDLLSMRSRLIFYTAWEVINRDKPIIVDQADN